MPDSVLQITDPQLIAQLRASFIAPAQKAQLEALVPKMNDGEKAELLNLIGRNPARPATGAGTQDQGK